MAQSQPRQVGLRLGTMRARILVFTDRYYVWVLTLAVNAVRMGRDLIRQCARRFEVVIDIALYCFHLSFGGRGLMGLEELTHLVDRLGEHVRLLFPGIDGHLGFWRQLH